MDLQLDWRHILNVYHLCQIIYPAASPWALTALRLGFGLAGRNTRSNAAAVPELWPCGDNTSVTWPVCQDLGLFQRQPWRFYQHLMTTMTRPWSRTNVSHTGDRERKTWKGWAKQGRNSWASHVSPLTFNTFLPKGQVDWPQQLDPTYYSVRVTHSTL